MREAQLENVYPEIKKKVLTEILAFNLEENFFAVNDNNMTAKIGIRCKSQYSH